MGDSKSIGQLLKELDAMQKQFNHLNEELIVENRKKKRVKTELSSNEIDDDFFKTFSAPLIEKNTIKKEQEKITETDLSDNELLFELELEQETVKTSDSAIESILSKEEVIEEKKRPEFSENADIELVSNEKKFPTQTENIEIENKKIEELKAVVNEQKVEIKDYSYLTIKQRLEKIQQEISLKEENLREIRFKNKKQDENKVIKLKQDVSSNKALAPKKYDLKEDKSVLNETSSVLKPTKQANGTIEKPKSKVKSVVSNTKQEVSTNTTLAPKKDIEVDKTALKETSSVLKPTKQANATIEKPKSKVKSAVLNPKQEVTPSSLTNKKTSPLNPKKDVSKKVKINSTQNKNVNYEKTPTAGKVTKQKDKKIETVDKLTIIILILLIVLLVTAWVLLF